MIDNHVLCAHSIEVVDHKVLGMAVDNEELTLAVLGQRKGRACSAIVVEKAVEPGSVDRDIPAVDNAQGKSVTVARAAVIERGIAEPAVGIIWTVGSVWNWLIVPKKEG